ncbi:MAG: DUF3311 domain-containing protein [Rubrobacteraceae bacterium]|uniref:DUF3311 domain-containing protein n=1 Tax=Rubrobacter naiadicus TaxID=1392641 RepID=UPI002360FEBC|nr:DUF3311 domain-containing protein [Rubrobacter naiadicus]MBX6765257.1 DUF3311 domain-containing protein [Rubrobacteraceae bacterium]MCL6439604.1 DUF3311 domain-containing protein [Rubrobacteraceae bacterium]
MSDRPPSPRGRPRRERSGKSDLWLLLLLVPFVGLLYPPFYAHLEPRLGGVPFFIWYQFVWVIVGVAVTSIVYRMRG